jgi:rhodanese-related sulfurtransferase
MLKQCQQLVAAARAEIDEISWAECDALNNGECILIDVREPHEFNESSVAGAINIPRGLLEFSIDSHPELKHLSEDALLNSSIILFCGTGGRSTLAARTLNRLGFKNVSSVGGGLNLRNAG